MTIRCGALSEPGYPSGEPCRHDAVVMGVKGEVRTPLCRDDANRALGYGWVVGSLPDEEKS